MSRKLHQHCSHCDVSLHERLLTDSCKGNSVRDSLQPVRIDADRGYLICCLRIALLYANQVWQVIFAETDVGNCAGFASTAERRRE